MAAPLGVVSWRAFLAAYETFRAAGVPDVGRSAPVLAAVERAVSAHEQISWGVYVEMIEEGRAHFESDEAFLRACENFDAAVPEVRVFASSTVRAQEFCKFIFQSFDVAAFPDVKSELKDLPDGSIDLAVSIPTSLPDSTVWFLANVGALKTMTRHLGLPPLQVDAEFGSHQGRYRMRFPDEAKERTGEATPAMNVVTELVTTLRADMQRAVQDARGDGARARLHQLAERWELTARQHEVLGWICRGLSNKQISAQVACAVRTVEIHVSDILRKAKLDSRAQLLASFADPED